MNTFAAEVSLILDELEAELILTQHIQGVLNFEADALSRLSQGGIDSRVTRQRHVSVRFFPKMMQVTKPGPSRMSCICAKDTLWFPLVHWL